MIVKVVFLESNPNVVVNQNGPIYVKVQFGYSGGGSGGSWGSISGALSDQTDLQNALDAKQATSLMSNYLGTGYSSHTHDYIPTGNSTNFLGTGYTTHTHPYINTSVSSQFITQQYTFSNSNNVTFGLNAGVVTASASFAGGVGGDGFNRISASNSIADTVQTINFSNANNVTFGLSNGVMTASASQSVQTQGTFNTTQLGDYRATSLDNQLLFTSQSSLFQLTADNSLSLGTGYTTHTHSQYVNTSQSSLFQQTSGMSNYQLSSGLTSKQDILTGSDGQVLFKVGTSAGSVQFGNLVYPDDMVNRVAAGSQTAGTLAIVVFSNSNNVSFGMSNSSVVTASFSQSVQTQGTFDTNNLTNYLTTQSGQAVSGSNGSVTFQTLSFGNLNGMSFYTSNGSIVASYTDAGGAGSLNISAGTTSNDLTNLVFSNSNNITFGLSGSTVTASFNPINVGISTNGNTAGTTGTIDGANAQYLFHGGNGITLSQSINGSSGTLSFIGNTNATLSRMYMWPYGQISSSGMTNSQMSLRYFSLDNAVSFSKLEIPINVSLTSSATAATGNIVFSSGAVIYSANGSTLNPIVGQLASTTHTWASNNTNYSNVIGGRYASFGLATALTPGEYWLGVYLSTNNNSSIGTATTQLANTVSVFLGSFLTAQNFVDFGQSTGVSSIGPVFMQGLISQVITNTAQTFQASQITMSGAQGLRGNILFNIRNI